jgi:hypothetical protein
MACSFYAYSLEFKKGMLAGRTPFEIPSASGPLRHFDGEEQVAFGSGRSGFREFWRTWKFSEVGGTSRAVFSAFADHLKSRKDVYSGGPRSSLGYTERERRRRLESFGSNVDSLVEWRSSTLTLSGTSIGITICLKYATPRL